METWVIISIIVAILAVLVGGGLGIWYYYKHKDKFTLLSHTKGIKDTKEKKHVHFAEPVEEIVG